MDTILALLTVIGLLAAAHVCTWWYLWCATMNVRDAWRDKLNEFASLREGLNSTMRRVDGVQDDLRKLHRSGSRKKST